MFITNCHSEEQSDEESPYGGRGVSNASVIPAEAGIQRLSQVLFNDEKYQKSPAQNLAASGQFPPLKNFDLHPIRTNFLYASVIDNKNVNISMPDNNDVIPHLPVLSMPK